MPYEIKPSTAGGKKGFRVFKQGTREAYSKEALPRARAEAQMRALYAAEGGYVMGQRGKKKNPMKK
jgi:hypothetical protein